MYLTWQNGQTALRQHDDLSSLKVVIEAAPDVAQQVRGSLASLVSMSSPDHVELSITDLKALGPQDDPAWAVQFDSMIAKASKAGWVNDSLGTVRAHVEWQSGDMQEMEAAFRAMMRKLAASVSIITVQSEGQPHGMTATAVTSLTMTPPAVLICVNQDASIHAPITRARRFRVNFLNAAQGGLTHVFSGREKGSARFAHGDWTLAEDAPPKLQNAVGDILCEVDQSVDYGTHTIFVGRVLDASAMDGDPLIYQLGTLGRFAELPAKTTPGTDSAADHAATT